MSYRLLLNRIYESAKKKDYDDVRQVLNMRLFSYRTAQIYCETIKDDAEAGRYIRKQAICKCGSIVTEWQFNKTPVCGSCVFRKAMEKIEYAKK